MNYRSFPRTQRWLRRDSKEKTAGSMLLLTLFSSFVLATLALGISFLSQIYLRTNSWRMNSIRLDYASENGIKTVLAEVMRNTEKIPLPKVLSEADYEKLQADLRNGQVGFLQRILELSFPIEILEAAEDLEWTSRADFLLESFVEASTFDQARCKLMVESEGKIKGLKPGRKSYLRGRLEVLCGHIPLFAFPLLVNKNLSQQEQNDFIPKNAIELVGRPQNLLPPRADFAAEPLIPRDADGLIAKALNIKIFRPQDLSPARLRFALGLEESDAPIPDGVYLIHNDLGLGGVYVQGNLDELTLAIEEDFQLIFFKMGGNSWLLQFSPSQSKTHFISPSGRLFFDLIPLGLIIVNGRIESFGGGTVDATGKIVPLQNEEKVPSLLQGVNLTLVASDKVTISSHLIRQGVVWQDGIPYLKEKSGQLIIFSTGKDLWQDEAREGGITVDPGDASQLEIHASLATGGDGFRLAGENKLVELAGSLQTTDYTSSGNRLRIYSQHLSAILAPDAVTPLTQEAVIFLSAFESQEWREYR